MLPWKESYLGQILRHAFIKIYEKNNEEILPGKGVLEKPQKNSLRALKKPNNICCRLYQNERKKFFDNLNLSFVKDNKIFWKTVKTVFLK